MFGASVVYYLPALPASRPAPVRWHRIVVETAEKGAAAVDKEALQPSFRNFVAPIARTLVLNVGTQEGRKLCAIDGGDGIQLVYDALFAGAGVAALLFEAFPKGESFQKSLAGGTAGRGRRGRHSGLEGVAAIGLRVGDAQAVCFDGNGGKVHHTVTSCSPRGNVHVTAKDAVHGLVVVIVLSVVVEALQKVTGTPVVLLVKEVAPHTVAFRAGVAAINHTALQFFTKLS